MMFSAKERLRHKLDGYKAKALDNAKRRESLPSSYHPDYINSVWPIDWKVIARSEIRARINPTIWNPEYKPEGRTYKFRWCENIHKSGLAVHFDNATQEVNRWTNGYYTRDDDFGDSIHGIVLALPNRRGFLAAVSDADNDGAAKVQTGLIWEDPRDAARDADRMAESDAQEMRSHDEAWQAGNRWSDLGDEIKANRESVRALIKDARKVCDSLSNAPLVLDVIRQSIKRARRDMRKAYKERRDLVDSVWSSYADSFNEAAGEKVIKA